MAWDWITAGIILGSFLLAAALIALILRRVFAPIEARFAPEGHRSFLAPLRGLLAWSLVIAGHYYGITSLDFVASNPRAMRHIDPAIRVLWTVLAFWTAYQIFQIAVERYVYRAASRTDAPQDVSNQATLIRKVGNIVLFAVALLSVLRVAGIDISPLLASGAIGGLAIALAAQDTFSNLFAGYFLAIDRPVRVGDFIKLETGQEGYVQDIGWRNTRLRLLQSSTVILPNSKLSQSIITNYHLPEQEMSLPVLVSVGYNSDLPQVEEITLEVAREVQREIEGAVPEWEPTLRWKEFAESGVRFQVTLRIREYTTQYLVQSEFLKRLYARFHQEDITFPK
jgi:small-conductance mechanosensitive channel